MFYLVVGEADGMRLGRRATNAIKEGLHDFFLYFSYLDSLAIQFSSWGADSW